MIGTLIDGGGFGIFVMIFGRRKASSVLTIGIFCGADANLI
jgi:hypothetical protein